jgi:hypothetical protein
MQPTLFIKNKKKFYFSPTFVVQSKKPQMKRIRDEDEVVEQLRKRFKEIPNSSSLDVLKFQYQNYEFVSDIKQDLISSIHENETKIFKFICNEYPSLVPPLILAEIWRIDLEMLKFLFEKKLVSQEDSLNFVGEDALMYWVKNSNYEIVKYLITVQNFDFTIKSDFRGYTGLTIFVTKIFSIFVRFGSWEFRNCKIDDEFHGNESFIESTVG